MLISGLVLIVAGIGVSLTPLRGRLRAAITAACVLGGVELVLIDLLNGSVRLAICIPLGVLFASLVGLILVVEQQPGPPDPAGAGGLPAADDLRAAATMRLEAEATSILDLRLSAGPAGWRTEAPAAHERVGHFRAAITVRAPLAERYEAEIRTSRQELIRVTVSFTPANPGRGRVSWMRRNPFPEIRIRGSEMPAPTAMIVRR